MKNRTLSDFVNKRSCTVIGIGISNTPLLNLLAELGVRVTARDKKSEEQLGKVATELKEKGVKLILGEGYLEGIDEDIIFRSPGIRNDLPQIKAACERGAVLTSEMEVFFELTPATVIGVTGSDGKTTTTTLIFKMLELEKNEQSRVFVGGNIGKPLLPRVNEMCEKDFAVVELSSFQLQTMRKSPKLAVITNVSPNHLNWHIDMNEYVDAKKNICASCQRLITNSENNITAEIADKSDIPTTYFSSLRSSYESIVPKNKKNCCAVFERDGVIIYSDGKTETPFLRTEEIKLPGRYNVENYMAAIGALFGMVSPDTVKKLAQSFGGVEHRMEFVRELDGVKYYNSSIDSTPTRTASALRAMTVKPIVICGGYDKKIPFDLLAEVLCQKAKAVVITGATAGKIKDAIFENAEYGSCGLIVKEKANFYDAVVCARELANENDTVVLSPACASFDAFYNFEERGNIFKKIVNDFK